MTRIFGKSIATRKRKMIFFMFTITLPHELIIRNLVNWKAQMGQSEKEN